MVNDSLIVSSTLTIKKEDKMKGKNGDLGHGG